MTRQNTISVPNIGESTAPKKDNLKHILAPGTPHPRAYDPVLPSCVMLRTKQGGASVNRVNGYNLPTAALTASEDISEVMAELTAIGYTISAVGPDGRDANELSFTLMHKGGVNGGGMASSLPPVRQRVAEEMESASGDIAPAAGQPRRRRVVKTKKTFPNGPEGA